MHLEELSGYTAVVTGASSGIGRAVAGELLSRGALVVGLDRHVGEETTTSYSLEVDLTDGPAVAAAISEVGTRHGLDVLVNNAGIACVGTVEETSLEEWSSVFDVNVLGIVRVTAAALPFLRSSSLASIVNMGSIAAHTGLVQRAAYSASKGAVAALTLAMAADYVAEGIRVNCVHPGTVDSPFVLGILQSSDDPEATLKAMQGRQPNGRLVTVEEVAHAVAYLASPSSGAVTGTSLAVDGGAHGLRVVRA